MKYRLITEYIGFIKSREEQDNIDYYNKYYVKNKHEGAECGCVYFEGDVKIKIYGVNDNDHSKDESGEMHVHIYTEFGESEYYVDCNNKRLTYKDGYKLESKYIIDLEHILKKDCDFSENMDYFTAIQIGWNHENQENKKAILI